MPLEELIGGGGGNAVAAILMLGSATNVYDAYSAVMSSPWSTEKFTEDEEAERMAREYVRHALVISGAYAAAASLIAHSVWPIVGAAGAAAYMYWLYNRALMRARGDDGMSVTVDAAPAEGWG